MHYIVLLGQPLKRESLGLNASGIHALGCANLSEMRGFLIYTILYYKNISATYIIKIKLLKVKVRYKIVAVNKNASDCIQLIRMI